MKGEGVLYYNHGERCLVRLLVSMHTLRRHYDGAVAVAAEGQPPDWFRTAAKKLGATIVALPVCHDYGLVKKSRLWRVTPFKHTMFIDADTVVRAPVQPFLDHTKQDGLVVTGFCGWRTSRGRMWQRVRQWATVAPKLVEACRAGDYQAINTGVQGWGEGHPGLPKYEQLTAKGLAAGVARKTLDEIAMQLVITNHTHRMLDGSWNDSCTYGSPDSAKIVHYHGHKHCRAGQAGDLWKREFWSLLDAMPDLRERLLADPKDGSVSAWLADEARPAAFRRDITVVTAVNPAYAERAERNLELWLKMDGLKEQDFLVFVNGFRSARQRRFLDRPNVKVVRWDYPFEATPRETMLAAFVLGVAGHVETPYWMKLDADTKPVAKEFKWPAYQGQTIVSHKWGYTKMKGDGGAPRHWFNRLDDLFAHGKPLFSKELDPVKDFKVSHRRGNPHGIPMRFGSFAHIEKTEFTRRIAKVVTDAGGRMPVPSQDTLSWYCATLWKEKVKLVNMKEFFQP